MNDEARMAEVIRYLDEHYAEQPTLGELAAAAGLSESHFHRLFSSWVGVTPKDFVQCLTMEHARALLRRGESVLETALDAGLSGPGRLHDLCVGLEAASPGEIKRGGAGLDLVFGYAASPFGECFVCRTERGISRVAFVEQGTAEAEEEERRLAESWPAAKRERDDAVARTVIDEIFMEGRDDGAGNLRTWVKGTAFQVKVWRALLEVPAGSLTTYGRLASAIGHPKAARAVGSAVGANPVAVLVPCHRVIRETGVLGQYHWGRGRKRALVAWETARK